jgi:hypothetical protein
VKELSEHQTTEFYCKLNSNIDFGITKLIQPPPHFIEVHVPSQESVLVESILSLSPIRCWNCSDSVAFLCFLLFALKLSLINQYQY